MKPYKCLFVDERIRLGGAKACYSTMAMRILGMSSGSLVSTISV